MVRLAILGWYGTETLGDRAILAGLLSLLADLGEEVEIDLGSIHPFLTERTLLEDEAFLRSCLRRDPLPLRLFNSRNRRELDAVLRRCDAVAVGGGPLMDVYEMFMVEYAFAKAKTLRKRTLLLGCGVGPLHFRSCAHSLAHIATRSDLSIFRDVASLDLCARLAGRAIGKALVDPAAFAAEHFLQTAPPPPPATSTVACLRAFPWKHVGDAPAIHRRLSDFLLAHLRLSDRPLLLLPMHYFDVGNDDRDFLNPLAFAWRDPRVTVQNNPLTLEETLRTFRAAPECVGMRFHSVLLQTLLNGRNIVLDYSEPQVGKTEGFLRQIGATEYFAGAYANLCRSDDLSRLRPPSPPFPLPSQRLAAFRREYLDELKLTLLHPG